MKRICQAVVAALAAATTDRDVKGEIGSEPLFSKNAKFAGKKTFELGAWGCWISVVGD